MKKVTIKNEKIRKYVVPATVIVQAFVLGFTAKCLFCSNKIATIDVPVVIVINENTASSAEVFAACLKENLDVDIVGVNSYGKGSVQKFVPLINGSYIKYTVLEWLTPNGNSIEGVGVEPTIRVELAPNSDVDKQLEKAIEVALEK